MSEYSNTQPLGLKKYLREVDTRVDPVPFIDILVIGLFFALFNSHFLLPPGISIDLPREAAGNLTNEPVAAVVTVLPPVAAEGGEGMVLFRGDLIRQESLESTLGAFLQEHEQDSPVLLIKMDSRASLAQLTAIADAARSAGFASVLVASEEKSEIPGGIIGK